LLNRLRRRHRRMVRVRLKLTPRLGRLGRWAHQARREPHDAPQRGDCLERLGALRVRDVRETSVGLRALDLGPAGEREPPHLGARV
jgi:hypothetical protein